MKKIINRVWAVKNLRNKKNSVRMYVDYFMDNLEEKDAEKLSKAKNRLFEFTSDTTFSGLDLEIYDEGINFTLEGVRTKLNFFCNYDGQVIRKPLKVEVKDKISLYSY
jgi:uncharacterized membrane protein YvbJ